MTEEQYLRIVRALRALVLCWVDGREPTKQEVALGLDASLALVEIAAAANPPLELAFRD